MMEKEEEEDDDDVDGEEEQGEGEREEEEEEKEKEENEEGGRRERGCWREEKMRRLKWNEKKWKKKRREGGQETTFKSGDISKLGGFKREKKE